MIIGLHSGKTFECDNQSYTEQNEYTGNTIRIFTNMAEKKKYTVDDAMIEFWEETLTDEDFTDLMTWGDDDVKDIEDNMEFG